MTKTTKTTKAQLFAQGMDIVAQGSLDSKVLDIAPAIAMPTLPAETILERAEIAQYNADMAGKAITIAPVASDVNDLYVPVKKAMKAVKTVKTGVGAQILQHIADGVLSNKEIVGKVLADNPLRKTTYACVAWYQSQVKAGKIDLPEAQEEVMMTEEELADEQE